MKVALSVDGKPVAILNRNETALYCVLAEAYEMLMNHVVGLEFLTTAERRNNVESIKIDINTL